MTVCHRMPRPAANCCSASGALFAWAYLPKLALRRGPRSAPAGDRAARRARRARRGGAGRRSGLGRAARRQGAHARRQDAGAAARRLLRAQSGDAEPAPALSGRRRRRSCMRPRRPIASARISTARTCWKAGSPRPGAVDTGWLNRALGDARSRRTAPIRGRATPSRSGRSRRWWCAGRRRCCRGRRRGCRRRATTRVMRLLDLYRHTDPALARVLEERMGLAAIARAGGMDGRARRTRSRAAPPRRCAPISPKSAGAAAKFLARPDGPRIGALAFDGWDTHANEGALDGRLAALLGALDGAIAAIETNMGDAWRETVVAVITEFGRTARINGTDGTDHGTGTVALLAGGALKGGRVIADWPGLQATPTCTRAATSSRPPTCAPCSRACCGITCASTRRRWRARCSRTAGR